MLELFVGDVYEQLSQQALAHHTGAVLINSGNMKTFMQNKSAVGYTSLADIGDHENFFQLCRAMDQIYYCPPKVWSHSDQQLYTEHVLAWVSQHVPVKGYEYLLLKHQAIGQDHISDTRKTDQPQLWISGCSITYGVGVGLEQTYRHIVAEQMHMCHSNLSQAGSSILWQSDQICQADIKPNDIVLWGLTGTNRIPVWHDDKVLHLNVSKYENHPGLLKSFPLDLLYNSSVLYHNVSAVRRAYNFCQKAGAKLVALVLVPDFDNLYLQYRVPVLQCLLPSHHHFVDFGTDNEHPGPKQHKIFAQEFLNLYYQLYD